MYKLPKLTTKKIDEFKKTWAEMPTFPIIIKSKIKEVVKMTSEYNKTVYTSFVINPLRGVFGGYMTLSREEDDINQEAKMYLQRLPKNLQTEQMLYKIWFALTIRRAIDCLTVSDAARIDWSTREL